MLFIELSLHNKHPFYWPDHLIILIIKALLSLCQKLVHLEKTTWASTVLETKINILRFFVLKRWFSRCPILSSTTIGLDYGIFHSEMKCTHQGKKEYTLKPVIITIILSIRREKSLTYIINQLSIIMLAFICFTLHCSGIHAPACKM